MIWQITSNQAAVQHAHAADRFAREIVGFLMGASAARLRRLMGNPLGAHHQRLYHPEASMVVQSHKQRTVITAATEAR
jgi:hypothetical protein